MAYSSTHYLIHRNVPFGLFVGQRWSGVTSLAVAHKLAVKFTAAADVRHAITITGEEKDVSEMCRILEEAELADFGHRFGNDMSTQAQRQAQRKASQEAFDRQQKAAVEHDKLSLDDEGLTKKQRKALKKRVKRAEKREQAYEARRARNQSTVGGRRVETYKQTQKSMNTQSKIQPRSVKSNPAVKFHALPGSKRVTHVTPEIVKTNYKVTNKVAQIPPLKLRLGQGVELVRKGLIGKVIAVSKDGQEVKIDLDADRKKGSSRGTMILRKTQPNDPTFIKIVMQRWSKAGLQSILKKKYEERQRKYEERQQAYLTPIEWSSEQEAVLDEPAIAEDVLALGAQADAPQGPSPVQITKEDAAVDAAFQAPPTVVEWHKASTSSGAVKVQEWTNDNLAGKFSMSWGDVPMPMPTTMTLQRSVSG